MYLCVREGKGKFLTRLDEKRTTDLGRHDSRRVLRLCPEKDSFARKYRIRVVSASGRARRAFPLACGGTRGILPARRGRQPLRHAS